MNLLSIILLIIYGLSFILSVIAVTVTVEHIELDEREDYASAGILASVVPLVNSILATIYVIGLFKRK